MAKVMLLRQFGRPLEAAELPVPQPEPGGLIVRMAAAGICGSDLEIVAGRDPRIGPDMLPMIPGHEGVGWVERIGGARRDMSGREIKPGDLIVWNRGITCGQCHQCAVRRRRSLCERREVYGITLPAREPAWLNGCYAKRIYVRPASELIALPPETDPASVVAATCSGATAAHAVELAQIVPGDSVLIIGAGPLGLFCAAFSLASGAGRVLVAGTPRSGKRLRIAEAMGCETLDSSEADGLCGERISAVIDAAGNRQTLALALEAVDTGGVVAIPGVASPIGEAPIDIYEHIARKNVRLQGVWVSDAAHLHRAVALVLSERYALSEIVTHRFALSEANAALAAAQSREAIKAVLVAE